MAAKGNMSDDDSAFRVIHKGEFDALLGDEDEHSVLNEQPIDLSYKEIKNTGEENLSNSNSRPSSSSSEIVKSSGKLPKVCNGFENDIIHERTNATCPTCQGTGKIYEDDGSLVALIPVKDRRLKPKRIKLKIFLAIFITLIVCGLTVFFLFPRSPTLELISTVAYNSSFLKDHYPYIIIKNQYCVTNNNFVPVTLSNPAIDVTWIIFQVGGPTPFYTFPNTTVGLRSSAYFTVYVKTLFDEINEEVTLRQWCAYPKSEIWFSIMSQMTSSFLFRDEQISSKDMKLVSCFYNATTLR